MYTTLIRADELEQCLSATAPNSSTSSRPVIVVDCRFSLADPDAGQRAYNTDHIPGAVYAHLDRDLSSPIVAGLSGRHPMPKRDVLEATFRQWGISQHTQLVAYDDAGGAIAARLWLLSRWLGHAACAVLDGGYAAWQSTHRISSEASSNLPVGNFAASAPLLDVMTIEQLNACAPVPTQQLLDARDAPRYRGEHEPIDPVAGHIPGAMNAPFSENLGDDGRFLSRIELADRFAPILSAAGHRTLVHYCGSGVTAVHNMLAMTHAGLPTGALYGGSWSEWSIRHLSDAERYPVATQVD